MRRSLAALIAFLAAFVAAPAMASADAPDSITDLLPAATYPAFYVPPSPLPAGKPGDLIRFQQFSNRHAYAHLRPGVIAYRVMYYSTSATGDLIPVTGTVLIPGPEKPAGGVANRPIISYGNEAIGLGDNCADSRLLQWGNSGEIPLYDPLLRAGFAVAATDYEGLGTPLVHTFGVTVSAAHSMLDIVRAARQLTAAHLPQNGPVGLFGYSQGGAAAAGAEELAPSYAPDVKITAGSFGGAPVNPLSFSRYNDGKLFSSVNIAAAAGYDAAYPELDLQSFLNDKGKAITHDAYNACIEQIFPLAGKKAASLLISNPWNDPRWQARFNQNTLGHIAPQVPTYYFHAVGDEAAPYFDAKTMRRQWCAGHTPLRFVGVPLIDHVMGGPLWMPTAAKWLIHEINGVSHDKGNCGYYPPRTEPAPPADGGV